MSSKNTYQNPTSTSWMGCLSGMNWSLLSNLVNLSSFLWILTSVLWVAQELYSTSQRGWMSFNIQCSVFGWTTNPSRKPWFSQCICVLPWNTPFTQIWDMFNSSIGFNSFIGLCKGVLNCGFRGPWPCRIPLNWTRWTSTLECQHLWSALPDYLVWSRHNVICSKDSQVKKYTISSICGLHYLGRPTIPPLRTALLQHFQSQTISKQHTHH